MVDVKRFLEPTLKNTLVHRIDPRTKLIVLIMVSIVSITIDNPTSLVGLFALSLIGYPLARIPGKNIKLLVILLALLIWGTIYSQALFYQLHPRTILFTILDENAFGLKWEGLHVFAEGIEYGAVQSMRLSTTTTLALLVYWTTDPSAMLSALIALKVPYGLAFMVITALRFVPLLIGEAVTVFRAQRLKGYAPFKPTNGFRTIFLALVPILANCIRRAAKLAVSVEGRSFQPHAPRTSFKGNRLDFKPLDKLLIAGSFLALPVLFGKLVYWLYTNNILYFSELRWVYAFAEKYI
jgi:energy-coupling factor transport system permease protein